MESLFHSLIETSIIGAAILFFIWFVLLQNPTNQQTNSTTPKSTTTDSTVEKSKEQDVAKNEPEINLEKKPIENPTTHSNVDKIEQVDLNSLDTDVGTLSNKESILLKDSSEEIVDTDFIISSTTIEEIQKVDEAHSPKEELENENTEILQEGNLADSLSVIEPEEDEKKSAVPDESIVVESIQIPVTSTHITDSTLEENISLDEVETPVLSVSQNTEKNSGEHIFVNSKETNVQRIASQVEEISGTFFEEEVAASVPADDEQANVNTSPLMEAQTECKISSSSLEYTDDTETSLEEKNATSEQTSIESSPLKHRFEDKLEKEEFLTFYAKCALNKNNSLESLYYLQEISNCILSEHTNPCLSQLPRLCRCLLEKSNTITKVSRLQSISRISLHQWKSVNSSTKYLQQNHRSKNQLFISSAFSVLTNHTLQQEPIIAKFHVLHSISRTTLQQTHLQPLYFLSSNKKIISFKSLPCIQHIARQFICESAKLQKQLFIVTQLHQVTKSNKFYQKRIRVNSVSQVLDNLTKQKHSNVSSSISAISSLRYYSTPISFPNIYTLQCIAKCKNTQSIPCLLLLQSIVKSNHRKSYFSTTLLHSIAKTKLQYSRNELFERKKLISLSSFVKQKLTPLIVTHLCLDCIAVAKQNFQPIPCDCFYLQSVARISKKLFYPIPAQTKLSRQFYLALQNSALILQNRQRMQDQIVEQCREAKLLEEQKKLLLKRLEEEKKLEEERLILEERRRVVEEHKQNLQIYLVSIAKLKVIKNELPLCSSLPLIAFTVLEQHSLHTLIFTTLQQLHQMSKAQQWLQQMKHQQVVMIQACFKGKLIRRKYKRERKEAVIKIQSWLRMYLAKLNFSVKQQMKKLMPNISSPIQESNNASVIMSPAPGSTFVSPIPAPQNTPIPGQVTSPSIQHKRTKSVLANTLKTFFQQSSSRQLSSFAQSHTATNMSFSNTVKNTIHPIIKECIEKQSKELDLSGCDLESLPFALIECKHVQVLDLSNNQLSSLPAWFMEAFPLVKEINLSQNNLFELPDHFEKCSELICLDLSQNKFEFFPDTLLKLGNTLQIVNLSSNTLTNVPSAITNLFALTYLNLSSNFLMALPQNLKQMKNLKELILDENPFLQSELANVAMIQSAIRANVKNRNLVTSLKMNNTRNLGYVSVIKATQSPPQTVLFPMTPDDATETEDITEFHAAMHDPLSTERQAREDELEEDEFRQTSPQQQHQLREEEEDLDSLGTSPLLSPTTSEQGSPRNSVTSSTAVSPSPSFSLTNDEIITDILDQEESKSTITSTTTTSSNVLIPKINLNTLQNSSPTSKHITSYSSPRSLTSFLTPREESTPKKNPSVKNLMLMEAATRSRANSAAACAPSPMLSTSPLIARFTISPLENQTSEDLPFVQQILYDDKMRQVFKIFCNNEKSSENLEFWEHVQLFKKEKDAFKRRRLGKTIYEQFIDPTASTCINIDEDMAKEVKEKIFNLNQSVDKTVFDNTLKHIENVMSLDTVIRFKNSDLYRSAAVAATNNKVHNRSNSSTGYGNQGLHETEHGPIGNTTMIPTTETGGTNDASFEALKKLRRRSVRENLEKETKKQKKLQEIAEEKAKKLFKDRTRALMEILESERKYVNFLDILHDIYYVPLTTGKILAPQLQTSPKSARKGPAQEPIVPIELAKRFFPPDFHSIITFNKNLLSQLETRFGLYLQSDNPTSIYYMVLGDIFIKVAPFFKVYVTYLASYESAMSVVRKACQDSPALTKWLEDKKFSPESAGQELNSLLIMPVQRIPRYKLLLESLLKRTDEEHPDKQSLEDAIEKIQECAIYQNMKISEVNNRMKVSQLATKLKIPWLVQPHRFLVSEGDLTLYETNKRVKGYLFSDIFLIQATKGKGILKRVVLKQYSLDQAEITASGNDTLSIHFGDKLFQFVFSKQELEQRKKWFNEFQTALENRKTKTPLNSARTARRGDESARSNYSTPLNSARGNSDPTDNTIKKKASLSSLLFNAFTGKLTGRRRNSGNNSSILKPDESLVASKSVGNSPMSKK